MKIQLQFEDSDLEEMIGFYFRDKGFAIKNLEEILQSFREAYPTGLNVMAEVISIPPAAAVPVIEAPPSLSDTEPPPARAKSTRALSISDLRDPELTPRFPTRDEQLRQEQEELDRILKRSKELAKE